MSAAVSQPGGQAPVRTEAERILESITEAFFGLDGEWRFTYLNSQAERMLGRTQAEMRGRSVWEEYPEAVGTAFDREYHRAMEEKTPVSFEEYYPPPLNTWYEVRAYPSPDGLSVYMDDITGRKETEARLASAYRRESLLNRIGQAVRRSVPPEEIEQAALGGLAEALGADRCLSVAVDAASDRVRFVAEWCRPDLPSLIGDYPITGFGAEIGHAFPGGQALTVPDVRAASWSAGTVATLDGMRIRSMLDVPFLNGDAVVGALSVSMAESPRAWTDDEVALAEAVASQLRAALEAVRTRDRERRIATELQEALQPPVPEHVPGLRVAPYLRPALDEAAVGGDFYDVFALDEGRYALVIGDVSGKGLAAAAQVALVRNSLRTVLYLFGGPAKAVTELNTILTAHSLLPGFVTAFVGVYDSRSGRIEYVSCGHEPPLVRRAGTDAVETLASTGLPLGAAEGAAYTTGAVCLGAGDGLLLYTDGLSEAGPNRREMLGTVGLTRILRALPPGVIGATVAGLVSDVGGFAQGVFRDDVCVLMVERI